MADNYLVGGNFIRSSIIGDAYSLVAFTIPQSLDTVKEEITHTDTLNLLPEICLILEGKPFYSLDTNLSLD